ncbi:MAG: tetratricopeptide repeat protein [Candidatus Hydrogenedentales bacterium]
MKLITSRHWWPMIALAILCIAVYGRCITFEYVLYDDPNIIFENEHVIQGLTWDSARWAILHPNFGLYMPLPTLTFMLDYSLYGDWAGGFHVSTLLWHILCVCLFYRVMGRLTKNYTAVFFASALVAIHPVQAMTINWISARNEIMPAVFLLLCIDLYRRYTEQEKGAYRKSAFFYAMSLFCMFLGMMSKQGAVLLPIVLLLFDYWPLKRIEISFSRFPKTLSRALTLAAEKIPYMLFSGLGVFFAFYGKRDFGAFKGSRIMSPLENIGFAMTGFIRYLFHLIYPDRYIMGFIADWTPPLWMVFGAALILIIITALALSQLWRRPWAIVLWGWFFFFLFPVSGLVRYAEESIALRYLYVPSMGLFLLLGFGLYELSTGKVQAQKNKEPAIAPAYWVPALLLLVLLSALAFRQSGFWATSEILAQRALVVTHGNNALAHNHLGVIRGRQGLQKQAFAHMEKCVELEPNRNIWLTNYAIMLNTAERYKESLKITTSLVEKIPSSPVVLNLHGAALAGNQRFEEAIPYLERAHEMEPDYVPVLYNYGVCLFNVGRVEEAKSFLKHALEIQPTHNLSKHALAQIEAQ